jgi:hypothetical protein
MKKDDMTQIEMNVKFDYKASDCKTERAIIEKVIEVSNEQFQEIIDNTFTDQKLFEIEKERMYVDDNNKVHSILLISQGREEGILVECEGYNYARYTSVIPQARKLIGESFINIYNDEKYQNSNNSTQGKLEEGDMRVMVVEPGKKPYEKYINNTLEDISEIVGGYIETYEMDNKTIVILNEEGKINNLEPNRRIPHDVLVGTFIVVGEEGEDFCSLTDKQIEYVNERFGEIETIDPSEIQTGYTVLPWII